MENEEIKKEIEGEREVLLNKVNAKLRPFNDKIEDIREKQGDKKVEIEIDGNYLNELKEQFKAHSKTLFTNVKALLEIADALGIED